jgi:cyclin B
MMQIRPIAKPNSVKASPMRVLPDVEEPLEDPQLATEYTPDIYAVLSAEEKTRMPRHDYMDGQPDLNAKMRAILVDWLVEVAMKYKLKSETLFSAVSIVDRYLEKRQVPRKKLQLVGVTGMLIAAKFEEIYPPEIRDFVYITDKAYTKEEVLVMEVSMLTTLEFTICCPSVVPFFERYQRINNSDDKQRHLVQYFLELTLPDIKMLRFAPSHLAAAATLLSNKLLEKQAPMNGRAFGVLPEPQSNWSPAMIKATGYTEMMVKNCAKEMCGLVESAESSPLQAVHKKFSQPEYNQVAKITF